MLTPFIFTAFATVSHALSKLSDIMYLTSEFFYDYVIVIFITLRKSTVVAPPSRIINSIHHVAPL